MKHFLYQWEGAMNKLEYNSSMAVKAHSFQGTSNYIGHDTYQNGLLNSNNSRIYMAGWAENWGAVS